MSPFVLLAEADLALATRIPLSVLNFLEFAIWGAWFVVLGNYLDTLKFSRKDIGRIYATMALGAVISPMFVGTIADQYFNSEQLMGVLHLVGAGLMFWMAYITTPRKFYWVALAYALVYSPTLALSNAVVFHNIPHSLNFPEIRVLGTIGWIAAGMSLRLFIKSGQPMNNSPLLLAAFLSLALGVYSFFLPAVPPAAAGEGVKATAVMGVAPIEVKDGGKGYTEAPTVTFEGDGTGAVAKAKVAGGKVTEIEVTDKGTGYTKPPKIVLLGGGGEGAKAEATLTIVAVTVEEGGSGFKNDRAISASGGGGSGAVLRSEFSDTGAVTKVNVVDGEGGKGYTEPPSVGAPVPGIPFVKALAMFKETSAAIFFTVSFLITIALAFYYSFTALYLEQGVKVSPENIGPMMTIGQWVEIIFMLTLPWFLEQFGMRWVLIVGMAAWGIRYAIFAATPPLPLVIFGIALHGICYDFFFAAGQIHTANIAAADIKASAQSLFAVLTYGLGMWLGTEASGYLNQLYTSETTTESGEVVRTTNWRIFWLVPCAGVVVSLIAFVLLFSM